MKRVQVAPPSEVDWAKPPPPIQPCCASVKETALKENRKSSGIWRTQVVPPSVVLRRVELLPTTNLWWR